PRTRPAREAASSLLRGASLAPQQEPEPPLRTHRPGGGDGAAQLGPGIAAADRGEAVLADERPGEQRPGEYGEQGVGEAPAPDVAVHHGATGQLRGVRQQALELLPV